MRAPAYDNSVASDACSFLSTCVGLIFLPCCLMVCGDRGASQGGQRIEPAQRATSSSDGCGDWTDEPIRSTKLGFRVYQDWWYRAALKP